MQLPDFLKFLDSDHASRPLEELGSQAHSVDLGRWLPFIFLHSVCLLVFLVGWSPESLILCFILYVVRMFAITGFYHRYFSHRSFKTSRLVQFLFAFLGACSVQRGPLWWASHHRHHHRYSDRESDVHSPVHRGFIWAHIGWITSEKNIPTDYDRVKDLSKFPELVWINRFDWAPPVFLASLLFFLGQFLLSQGRDTSGAQFVVWGFVSTVILFHATSCINSVGHIWGSQRFKTNDESRNNLLLAIFTLGEGWHNNHHQFPGATRQGYMWWELDITYMILKLLEKLGIVWDLTTPKQLSAANSSFTVSSHPVGGNAKK